MKTPKEIGQILKEARQKKGFNLDGVYKATRIQPRVVDLLEKGRADEALSRIYTISFLKKYAFFLDLDGNALAADYKSFYTDKEKQVLILDGERFTAGVETQKWMIFSVTAAVALLSIFFILFLGIKLRAAHRSARDSGAKSVAIAAKPKSKPKPGPKAKPESKPVSGPAIKTESVFPIPNNKPIRLILEGTDDVWMKVKKDGKRVFEGTLRKNEKKEVSAKNQIELWTGRAEALKFSINGRSIGKIGKGNIKNIKITRSGLNIGNKRLFGAGYESDATH